MDLHVADPHWGGWIIAYFFLGGIAAGAYAMACGASLFGTEEDRRSLRGADYLAFPIVNLCGLILVVDLGRPERFWHMLIQSETFRPMFKWWSPMSAGSWALSAFGLFAAFSFVGVLVEDGWLAERAWSRPFLGLRRGWAGKVVAAGGAASAFFLGSYTGVLLAVTNQPGWSQTPWLGALFLASAASTGLAALILLACWRPAAGSDALIERLERADDWAIGLESLMLAAFALDLGDRWAPLAFGRWPGVLIPAFVVPVGLVTPPLLKRLGRRWRGVGALAAALVLVAGLALRVAVVGLPGSLIAGGRASH